MKFWIEINTYRNSTNSGFANTWRLFWLDSKKKRDNILKKGLPVRDCFYSDGSYCYSTNGIRIPDRQTVRRITNKYAEKYLECYNYELTSVD